MLTNKHMKTKNKDFVKKRKNKKCRFFIPRLVIFLVLQTQCYQFLFRKLGLAPLHSHNE